MPPLGFKVGSVDRVRVPDCGNHRPPGADEREAQPPLGVLGGVLPPLPLLRSAMDRKGIEGVFCLRRLVRYSHVRWLQQWILRLTTAPRGQRWCSANGYRIYLGHVR